MLHKKHTVKEKLTLGKSEVKKIRGEFLSRLGDDMEDFCDSVWDKKSSSQRRRWQISTYSCATVYLVNDVPLLLAVDGFPEDVGDLLKESEASALLPTVFLLLKAQLFFGENKKEFLQLLGKFGSTIVCRGPTSRFLLSGAHLMMPGVVGIANTDDDGAGDAALVTSLGRPCPYAVGYCTSKMKERAENGVGVYIVHTYNDNLWNEFRDVFISSCGPGVVSIPPYFAPKEVPEDWEAFQAANDSGVAQDEAEKADAEAHAASEAGRQTADVNDGSHGRTTCTPNEDEPKVEISATVPDGCDLQREGGDVETAVERDEPHSETADIDVGELFCDADSVLDFALCQTVLSISPSRLPLPVAQFNGALVLNYPRGLQRQGTIDFKKTPYKKALAFLSKRSDTVTVTEVRNGVHEVTALNRASERMREHKRRFADYIRQIYSPALLVEAQDAEQRLLHDSKTVFHQQLLSVSSLYKPRRNTDHDVLLALLAGDTSAGMPKPNFPSLQEMESGKAVGELEEAKPALDTGAMDELYSRKTLVDNLKAYVKHNRLMNPGDKGQLPTIKIEGMLCEVVSRSSLQCSEIPLDQLESQCLRQFTEVCEIVMQTSITGSSITSTSIPPVRVVKNGAPPLVNMWTEKRAGNKTITIVRNLEALCFNLNMLSAAWRQRFSTSCTVFDPSTDMKNLKSGTKVPLEIHVQGDKTKDLTNLFAKELGVPTALLQHHR